MKGFYWLGAFLFAAPLFAQQASSFRIAPSGVVHLGAGLEDPWMPQLLPKPSGDYYSKASKVGLKLQKQASSLAFPRKVGTPSMLPNKNNLPVPVLGRSFQGNYFNSSVPLDNYLAFNRDSQIVSVVNTTIQVYDMTDGSVSSSKTLKFFTQAAGLGGFLNNRFDPKVIYDPLADKFIAVVLNGNTPATSKILMAFSQSNDPTGDWNIYTLPGNPFNDTTWFDFPTLSITEDEVFVTGNQIKDGVSWQLGFTQSVIWQMKKAPAYAGDTLISQIWSGIGYGGRPIRNLHAVTRRSELAGSRKQYFLSNRNFDLQNDTLFFVTLSDTMGAAQVSVEVMLLDKAYGLSPDARQPDTSKVLATNDARVLSANLDRNTIHFAGNSIDTAHGSSGIYFGEIQQAENPGQRSVRGWVIGFDSLDLGYPNLATMGYQNGWEPVTLIAFNHSGPNTFPGHSVMLYHNGNFSEVLRVKEGEGNLMVLNGGVERWGDYFGAQQDYDLYGRAWISGTFGFSNSRHSTWITEVFSPFGSAPSSIEEAQKSQQVRVFPNPGYHRVHVSFSLPGKEEVLLEVYDMQGKKLHTLYKGEGYAGEQVIAFEAGHLASGSYVLRISSASVQSSQTFIKP